jgi:hypothetical protein
MRRFKVICRHSWNKRRERTVKTVEMFSKCVAINVIGKTPQGRKVKLERGHQNMPNYVGPAIRAKAPGLFPRDGFVVAHQRRH